MAKPKAKKALLKLLKTTFSGLNQCEEIDVKDAYRLSDKKVKVHIKEYPFLVNLTPDSKPLHLYPEIALDGSHGEDSVETYILFDPDAYYTQICGFYRLDNGDKITLGGDDLEQRIFLNLSEDIPRRMFSIGNDDGWLTFKSHVSDCKPCIAPLLKDKKVNRIITWRQKKLQTLRDLLGNPIERLSSDDALNQIREVNAILEDETNRPKDKSGRPGGVIALPENSRAVIVGDLHAKPDNLLTVLSHNGFLEALEEDRATLILIGDAVHPEGDAVLDEMESSILIMDLIFELKRRFPKNMYYIRGNHDSYSDEIAKNGIPQGLLWAEALQRTRGKAYKEEMMRFYKLLPYVAYSKHFVTCHAGPPKSSITFDEIVNMRDHPKLRKELTTNRMKAPNRLSGYNKGDVRRFKKCLDVDSNAPLVVGHTPLSADDTFWENAGDIEHHHIIYGSDSRQVAVLVQIEDKLYPLRYPVEPIISTINAMND